MRCRRMLQSGPCLGAVTLLFACASVSGGPTPRFEWNPTFAAPGTSLEIRETSRRPSPMAHMGTTVRYELSATGFSSTDSLVMWYKVGEEYSQFPVTVEADGRLTIAIGDNARPGFSIFGYVDGQAFDVALVSSTTGQRAHGKTVPFPLRAESPGGCSIDAEVLTTSGLLFLMTLNGFAPDDSVTIRSEHRGEVIGSAQTVPASGVIGMPVLFERGSGGPATFSARSRSCEVLLQFTVGIDEMDVR